MKSKAFNKKLTLNKKTVANLNKKEMQGIYGGETRDTICYSKCVTNCIFCYMTFHTDCCIP